MPRQFDDEYDDTWRYERFIVTIQQKAGISWEKAERAARATLATLAERISSGEARDLAADLPTGLREPLLGARGGGEPVDAREFVRRVGEREGIDAETAREHARAVFVALARLVRSDEVRNLLAELPSDYAPLLREAATRGRDPSAPEPLPADVFVDRVQGRAGLPDPADAQRAVGAVLETLAERLSGGEVDDIASALAPELRPPLERGREAAGGKAQRIGLDEFIARVGEREGVDRERAADHARAVFATLREALGQKELSDMLAELPRAYDEALL